MGDWAATHAASVYEYTIGRLFAADTEDVSPSPASPVLPPQAGTDENVPYLLDMLCMCREFTTPVSGMATQLNATQCQSIRFTDRWAISTDISHVRSTHVHVQGSEIVVGGLHVLVFHAKAGPPATVIAFRHQEGESLLDNDMWEAMALYGRNFVQLALGPSPLSAVDYGSRAIQALLFGSRHTVEMDYFSLAKALVAELVGGADDTPVTFTGYSIGGALAQLMAVHWDSHATVFASNGVLDILGQYHVNPALLGNISTRLVNVMHPRDDVPKLDCQIGTLVLHHTETPLELAEPDGIHTAFVYGDLAWNQLHFTPLEMRHGRAWSQSHGFCIDNNLAESAGFTLDAIAQTTTNQALATFLAGAVVLVLVKGLAALTTRLRGGRYERRKAAD